MIFFIFFIFFLFFPNEQRAGGGGGGAARLVFFFPCSADHERDWPPCKVVFFGLATNALNVRNNKQQGFMFYVSLKAQLGVIIHINLV